jgi:hypothetical protein
MAFEPVLRICDCFAISRGKYNIRSKKKILHGITIISTEARGAIRETGAGGGDGS